jgi:hypothetical protein
VPGVPSYSLGHGFKSRLWSPLPDWDFPSVLSVRLRRFRTVTLKRAPTSSSHILDFIVHRRVSAARKQWNGPLLMTVSLLIIVLFTALRPDTKRLSYMHFNSSFHVVCLETHYAASRLLVLVLGLAVVARSYLDGLTSPDTNHTSHASHGLVGVRLLFVHQREARKPVKDGDTCSSVDTQCWQNEHGVDEWCNAWIN